jgi:hypothetical protein
MWHGSCVQQRVPRYCTVSYTAPDDLVMAKHFSSIFSSSSATGLAIPPANALASCYFKLCHTLFFTRRRSAADPHAMSLGTPCGCSCVAPGFVSALLQTQWFVSDERVIGEDAGGISVVSKRPKKSGLSTTSTHEIYRPDPLDAFPDPKIQTPTTRPVALSPVSILPPTSLLSRPSP